MTLPILNVFSYDATSLGRSKGSIDTVELADWVDNAATVLETLGSKKNLLVGNSMGGWISLWLASQKQFADKISGLVLVAPAVNFPRIHYDEIYPTLSPELKQQLNRGEVGGKPN